MSNTHISVEQAVEDVKAGKMVIIVDDEDRENEGDLAIAAEKVTPEAINFMATYARGLVCVPMLAQRLKELQLPIMVQENTARLSTAFTVSVDALEGTTTGISAQDRAVTIKALLDPATTPEDLARPRPHLPAALHRGRGACQSGPDRGRGRSGAAGRSVSRRGDLRGHDRGRHHGPHA